MEFLRRKFAIAVFVEFQQGIGGVFEFIRGEFAIAVGIDARNLLFHPRREYP
jgi:hypothetical protein